MPFNLPNYNLTFAQWSIPRAFPPTPPVGAPVRTGIPCAARQPRTSEIIGYVTPSNTVIDLVLAFGPPLFSTSDWYDFLSSSQQPDLTVFELPPGSNNFWLCVGSRIVGRGYPNEHKVCYCCRVYHIGMNVGH